MRFVLEIELGNDAMRDGCDVAAALRRVRAQIENIPFGGLTPGRGEAIIDENGNKVGEWRISVGKARKS